MSNENTIGKINTILKKINRLVSDIDVIINDNALADKEKHCKVGSISYRKDGRFMGRFTRLGKTYYVYDTSKERCAQKLADKYKQVASTATSINRKMTWHSWVSYWWENYKVQVIKESTASIYRPYMDLIVSDDNLNEKLISKVNDVDLLKLINSLSSNKKRLTCHMLLRDICDKAVRNGLMKRDMSCFVVKKCFVNRKVKNMALTKDEVRICTNYLSTYNEDIYNWFIFTLNTGVRIGESLALSWNDIDFKNKTILINKAYNQTTKTITIPKTNSSFRIIPLFKHVEKLLLSMNRKGDLIFDININSIKTALQNITRIYNIKVSPHMLRHTFATKCLEHNVNSKVVQEWLGHNSIQTTQDLYQHINCLNIVDTNKMDFDTYN